MPRNSAYIEAITQDEEWAALALADRSDQRPAAVRMRDYSPEVERLTDLVDRVGELITATIAAAGGRPKRAKPALRPRTALERVRNRNRDQAHRSLVARVLVPRTATAPAAEPSSVATTSAVVGPGTAWLRQRATRRVT